MKKNKQQVPNTQSDARSDQPARKRHFGTMGIPADDVGVGGANLPNTIEEAAERCVGTRDTDSEPDEHHRDWHGQKRKTG